MRLQEPDPSFWRKMNDMRPEGTVLAMLKQKSTSPHSIFSDINPTGTGSAP
jgi:hypothetical protein